MPMLYNIIQDRPDGPCIRLLHLEPRGDHNDPLRVNLATFALETSPKYEALSYVWGDSTRGVPIECNGETLEVTENLFGALSHLHYKDRIRLLWVDAVCINQQDDSEKSHQVNIMGSIYRRADRVLIWLGPAADQSDVAFGYIDRTFAQLRLCPPSVLERYKEDEDYRVTVDFDSIVRGFAEEGSIIREDASDLVQAESDGSHDDPLESIELSEEEDLAFSALMRRPWWARVWIIQELCLSSEATLICGDSSVSWEAFTVGIVHYHNDDETQAPLNEMARYYSLAKTRLNISKSNVQLDLLEAVSAFRWFKATNPRDKVYSLLGVAGKVDIRPDYVITIEQCYTNTAYALISNLRTLDVLDFVVPPSSVQRLKLPSWVPDWSYDEASIDKYFRGFVAPPTTQLAASLKNYGGGRNGRSKPNPTLSESQAHLEGVNILVLRGMTTDSITLVEDVLKIPDTINPMMSANPPDGWASFLSFSILIMKLGWWVLLTWYRVGVFLDYFRRLMKFAERARPHLERQDPPNPLNSPACLLLDVLRRNIQIDEDSVDELESAEILLKFWDDITSATAYRIFRRFGFHILFPFLDRLLLVVLALCSPLSDDVVEVAFRLVFLSVDHRPAMTQKGRLCLTPHTCRVGDQVALLQGGRHPYIVRKTSEWWELVGPCYMGRFDMQKEWQDEDSDEMRFE